MERLGIQKIDVNGELTCPFRMYPRFFVLKTFNVSRFIFVLTIIINSWKGRVDRRERHLVDT